MTSLGAPILSATTATPTPLSSEMWEAYKDKIVDLFANKFMSLEQIREIMAAEHGFQARSGPPSPTSNARNLTYQQTGENTTPFRLVPCGWSPEIRATQALLSTPTPRAPFLPTRRPRYLLKIVACRIRTLPPGSAVF